VLYTICAMQVRLSTFSMRLQFSKLFALRVKKRIYIPHNYSVKLILEAIIILIAIIIPGGLIVYFGWKACRKRIKKKPCPDQVTEEFREHFPIVVNRREVKPLDPKNRYPH